MTKLNIRRSLALCATLMAALCVLPQNYLQRSDISYTVKTDEYSRSRLKLDVYYPSGARDVPVVLWFHGGGMEGGTKHIPAPLQNKGWVVVAANYRLLPHVAVADILDDAAEAVAWVMRHAQDYGGDPAKVVVTGHSAGGYLALMLCLNKQLLSARGVDADSVMLYAPMSGQAVTHFNVRKMQGLGPLRVTIDQWAPIYWVRGDCPPLVLVCGDRELELYGRYDENQYLARMMKLAGHKDTYLYEIDGHDHNDMIAPGLRILDKHMQRLLDRKVTP